ncbi:MAG: glycoside hydrolase family 10 protein [Nodosilinea sp.]
MGGAGDRWKRLEQGRGSLPLPLLLTVALAVQSLGLPPVATPLAWAQSETSTFGDPVGAAPSSLDRREQIRALMGRLESALLLVQAQTMASPLTLPLPQNRGSNLPLQALHPALAEAEQLLADWPQLEASKAQADLESRWLQVRSRLWQGFPLHQLQAQPEIRALWLDRAAIIAAGSDQALEKLFDRLAAAGVNTIFFEAVNAGYPLYSSQVAPQPNPQIKGWDPLASAVRLAHARNMTLHAWVWVFAVGNQSYNRLLNLPPDYPGPILTRHPDWASYDNQGRLILPGQDKPFLDPAHPEVRRYLLNLLKELTSHYPIDGVHLDYIRYPFQDPQVDRSHGYGEVSRWQFHRLTGVDPLTLSSSTHRPLTPSQVAAEQVLWQRWTDFRQQQVTEFVAQVSTTLRRQRPDLVLSAAVFAQPTADRRERIQQDWETWARSGNLDWVVLMSYAETTPDFQGLAHPWLGVDSLGSALVIPGIRLLDLSASALADQIQTARDWPTPGYALFAASQFRPDLALQLTPSQPLEPPQGALALQRYQALQREWHWLLTTGRLTLAPDRLADWVGAVNRLELDLQGLDQQPSQRRLAQVKRQLAALRHTLGQEVTVAVSQPDYRLQVWQDRLWVVEHLLQGGDRPRL